MDHMESCVPPGFRFHPTEEELVGYYLKRKVNSLKFDIDVIIDIDLYRMEPWEIQDKCKLGYDEQNEWYFFSHKDRKYPTGTRTNRATAGGFWKATGRDKAVLSKEKIIGMRKTLVFYRGRAPNGRKTDWIMHEYRLQNTEHAPPQEEGWVVCRAFKKPSPSHKQGIEAWNHHHHHHHQNLHYMRNNYSTHNNRLIACSPSIPDTSSPIDLPDSLSNQQSSSFHYPQQCHSVHQPYNTTPNLDQDFISSNGADFVENQLHLIMDLPRLDSPSLSTSFAAENGHDHHEIRSSNKWEILDTFLGNNAVSGNNGSFSSPQSMQQLISSDYDLDVQNQLAGSYMECFPNL